MAIYTGGVFFDKPNNVKYEHGTVMFVDLVSANYFNRFKALEYVCGDCDPLKFYFML